MPDPFDTHYTGGSARQPSTRPTGERYRMLRKLGAGSMGEVYLAEDRKLKRRVAIKSIRADKASAAQILRRIKRESMLHAQIGAHPNIVTLYDFLDGGDKIHLVMEYVEGDTLDHILETHRRAGRFLPVGDCLDIAIQCLRGLAHVHDRGIIHRDIKPANVMVTRDPAGHYQAKIMDFGVARQEEQAPDVTTLTQPGGRSPGTPLYMAPEQIDSRKYGTVTPAADIYAVGVMLYQLISGDPPFTGSLTDVFNGHLNLEPEPIRFVNGTAPHPALEAAIDRALEKKAVHRYASAREFAARLEEVHDIVEQRGALVYDSDSVLEAAWGSSLTRWMLVTMAGLVLAGAGYLGWKNEAFRDAIAERDFSALIPSLLDERALDGPLPEVTVVPSPAITPEEAEPKRAATGAAKAPAAAPAPSESRQAPAPERSPEPEPEVPPAQPVKVAQAPAPAPAAAPDPAPVSDGTVKVPETSAPVPQSVVSAPAPAPPSAPATSREIIPPLPAPESIFSPDSDTPPSAPARGAPLVADGPAQAPMENLANLEPLVVTAPPATPVPAPQLQPGVVVEDALDTTTETPQGVMAADIEVEPHLESVATPAPAVVEDPDSLESIDVEPIPPGGVYVIAQGDTLNRIAGRFNISVKSLAEWNKLQEPFVVRPGQQLYLYERPDLNPPAEPAPITEPAVTDAAKKEPKSRELLRKTKDRFMELVN